MSGTSATGEEPTVGGGVGEEEGVGVERDEPADQLHQLRTQGPVVSADTDDTLDRRRQGVVRTRPVTRRAYAGQTPQVVGMVGAPGAA